MRHGGGAVLVDEPAAGEALDPLVQQVKSSPFVITYGVLPIGEG